MSVSTESGIRAVRFDRPRSILSFTRPLLGRDASGERHVTFDRCTAVADAVREFTFDQFLGRGSIIVGDWVGCTAVADSRVAMRAGHLHRSSAIHIGASPRQPNHTLERTAARLAVFPSEFRLGMARARADRRFGGCRSVLIR